MVALAALVLSATLSWGTRPTLGFAPAASHSGRFHLSAVASSDASHEERAFVENFDESNDFASSSSAVFGLSRRRLLSAVVSASVAASKPLSAAAAEGDVESAAATAASGDAKPLFNEARALELQGRMEAAQRLYAKVTKISPRFVYGWSNLGNAQVALGNLGSADESYTTSIDLCREKNADGTGRKCNDLYLILLNRGCIRLNDGRTKEALRDLEEADALRGRPDSVVLQNRARAREVNGFYSGADRDYAVSISMTSNEVAPFWLRAAMVKYQLGDKVEAYNLLKRVENRFPEAPEVRAAAAAMLVDKGDMDGARRKYLEIPDRQRLKFVDRDYLTRVISWPPAMTDSLALVSKAVGDGP
eukprot:CAMPEP_0113588080 /NCGR_PEP_ID=MMETSP0015_2-20120614/35300_1 /TAXON_ID=2838 /ORGANISM="Odontella" /LENGTH=360 /DNA_ID=CAMNT_0000493881 /DNA_START=15 /DNA_END=1098 /DNA_ORIENTATION=- /assembly_acc=CAM_ASM_000160